MQLSLNHDRTNEYLEDPKFRQDTIAQILKDFAIVGFEIEETNYRSLHNLDEIVFMVEESFNEVMEFGEPTVLRLLYQIDIPQKDFLNIVQDKDFMSKISVMIVYREAYKVYLRTKF